MSTEDELAHLRRLNRKLIALLESRGIDWQTELDTLISAQPASAPRPTTLTATDDTTSTTTYTTTLTPEQKIALFRKLFRGRADVYPVRWENNAGRSGYSLACHNEWKPGVCGKPTTKCSDCHNQSWKSVTDQVIYDHLAGKHAIGVYPLISLSDDDTGTELNVSDAQVRPTDQSTATTRTKPTKEFVRSATDISANRNKPDKLDHCHFLAVDFDEGDWQADAKAFRASCDQFHIPCSIEISRSGNGAHAWIFFSEPVPAKQARNLGSALISHACANYKATDHQPALTSYDRMFPNQDSVTKTPQSSATVNIDSNKSAGFGNLIALPLQKHPRTQGHSVFVDHDFVPYPDQWAYLASITPMSAPATDPNINTLRDHIDSLMFQAVGNRDALDVGHFSLDAFDPNSPWQKQPLQPTLLTSSTPIAMSATNAMNPNAKVGDAHATITLTLSNLIYIPKADLSPFLTNRLIRIAAFQNPEYYKAQALGFSVWNKPRIICRADNFPHHIGLPRGCLDAVIELFAQHHIRCEIQDERNPGTPLNSNMTDSDSDSPATPNKFTEKDSDNFGSKLIGKFIGNLRPDQTRAVTAMLAHDQGVLCAPTAFGKTVTAAALIAERGVNTLIIVHRKELLKQWQERLCTFLDIDPKRIGIVTSNRQTTSKKAPTTNRKSAKVTALATSPAPATVIDIAMVQSLIKQDEANSVVEQYGHVIVDECHHVSAASFEQTLKAIKAKYVLGLTATPIRRDGRQPIIMMQCGPVRHRATRSQTTTTTLSVQAHEIPAPVDKSTAASANTEKEKENAIENKTQSYAENDTLLPIQEVFRQLAENTKRTEIIVDQAIEQFHRGRKVLLLTERTDHLLAIKEQLHARLGIEPPLQPDNQPLQQQPRQLSGENQTPTRLAQSIAFSILTPSNFQDDYRNACSKTSDNDRTSSVQTELYRSDCLFTLHGRLKKSERTEILRRLEFLPAYSPRILLATGKLIGEGFDHAPLDTLILAMPISWKGTLQQYVGRLHREHANKTDILVIDFIDQSHPSLVRMWNKRQAGYKAMGYAVHRINQLLNH